MKPLIKWPGGKSREYSKFEEFIPKLDRYFEPFVGGGGVLFKLEPKVGYVNDIDSRLINFYIKVQTNDAKFHRDLKEINQDWIKIEGLTDLLLPSFLQIFPNSVEELIQIDNIKELVKKRIDQIELDEVIASLEYVDPNVFQRYLNESIISKTHRIRKLQIKHDKIFSDDLLRDHLMTAIKSAYYTLLRNEYFNAEGLDAASFYFVREFCYGSMFRFNSSGEFNIPYGGINYNHKDFASKIASLKNRKILSFLQNIKFHNLDFREFLRQFTFSEDDFIFLDPPYDSNFKNYGQHPFGEEKQRELAEQLSKIDTKWMLVIQETPLIRELYTNLQKEDPSIQIISYDKSYTYNVRGRNDRKASHLLIMNYSL